MLTLLLCSHSNFAEGIKNAVEMICGKQDNLEVLSLMEGDSLEDYAEKIKKTYDLHTMKGHRVICLCDIPHATPYNAIMLALHDQDVHLISGVSLPIVLELVLKQSNESNYDSMIEECFKQAKECTTINKIKDLLTYEHD